MQIWCLFRDMVRTRVLFFVFSAVFCVGCNAASSRAAEQKHAPVFKSTLQTSSENQKKSSPNEPGFADPYLKRLSKSKEFIVEAANLIDTFCDVIRQQEYQGESKSSTERPRGMENKADSSAYEDVPHIRKLVKSRNIIIENADEIKKHYCHVARRRKRRQADAQKKKRGSRKQRHRKKNKNKVCAYNLVPNLEAVGNMKPGECKSLWDAKVCKNNTLTTKDPNYSLRFWAWPSNLTATHRRRTTPVVMPDFGMPGRLEIHRSGLYQLYVQVLFLDDWLQTAVSIVINDSRVFKCIHDVGDGSSVGSDVIFFNTCSVMAVARLKKGDRVKVNIIFADSIVALNGDSTYFTIIFLSS